MRPTSARGGGSGSSWRDADGTASSVSYRLCARTLSRMPRISASASGVGKRSQRAGDRSTAHAPAARASGCRVVTSALLVGGSRAAGQVAQRGRCRAGRSRRRRGPGRTRGRSRWRRADTGRACSTKVPPRVRAGPTSGSASSCRPLKTGSLTQSAGRTRTAAPGRRPGTGSAAPRSPSSRCSCRGRGAAAGAGRSAAATARCPAPARSESRGLARRMCAPSGQRRPARVVGVVAEVGASRASGSSRVRGQHQRGAAAPAADHLGGEPLLRGRVLVPAAVRVRSRRNAWNAVDVLAELAHDEVGAVAPEVRRPRCRPGRGAGSAAGRSRGRAAGAVGELAVLVGVAEHELAGARPPVRPGPPGSPASRGCESPSRNPKALGAPSSSGRQLRDHVERAGGLGEQLGTALPPRIAGGRGVEQQQQVHGAVSGPPQTQRTRVVGPTSPSSRCGARWSCPRRTARRTRPRRRPSGSPSRDPARAR